MSWEDEVSSVDTQEGRTERARALLEAVLAAEDIPAAARELFSHDDLAGVLGCTLELERLRAIPRMGATVTRLERAARAAARKVTVRIAGEDEAQSIRDALCLPADWPDYPVPFGYEASVRGIMKLERQGEGVIPVLVSHEPIAVVGVRVDVGTGRESLELGFRRHGQWRRVTVAREVARDARALVALAGQGLPVSSVTSRTLVAWLDACEAMATSLPRSQCTSRTGWHGDVYLMGPGGDIELDDPEDAKSGWVAQGTWEGWKESASLVENEPAAWLTLYAACTAPLLRFLGLGHCPIVDLSGPRGRGKTTCLRWAGSGWGRADDCAGGTVLTWDASPTHVERLAAATWDAPMLLDDTKRARRPADVTMALYALAQGRGRGRGTPGGVQKTSTWRTTAISTGEAPLVEATEAGGARARVLSITITPAISSLALAKKLEAIILIHHGHLGPRVAARAIELGGELRSRYLEALAKWAGEIPADTRLLSTAAALEVAAGVLAELGLKPQCDWRAALADALSESVAAADQSGRALDVVREEFARHRTQYQGQEPTRTVVEYDSSGRRAREEPVNVTQYRGVWLDKNEWVGIYPGVLKQILEEAGHDITPVVTQWLERELLLTNRGHQFETTVAGHKQRVYAFKKAHVL